MNLWVDGLLFVRVVMSCQVYGDVERTIDCYRRALEIGPAEKPSLYINLAGVLDQMNFIRDAMQVAPVF